MRVLVLIAIPQRQRLLKIMIGNFISTSDGLSCLHMLIFPREKVKEVSVINIMFQKHQRNTKIVSNYLMEIC